MPMITPNFNFAGRCEEAIHLYQKAFGANVGCLLRYKDADKADWDKPLNSQEENYIYHAELLIGNQRMMMCDNLDIPFSPTLSLSLTVTFDTKEQVLQAHDILQEGGSMIYPIQSTTYSSCTTVLVDKFGFRWGLMTEQTER